MDDLKDTEINKLNFLLQWRMQEYQLIGNRINFLIFAQSIFILAYLTVLTSNIEFINKNFVVFIIAISGFLLAWIFGYMIRAPYERELSRVDTLYDYTLDDMKINKRWFKNEYKLFSSNNQWLKVQGAIKIHKLASITIPRFLMTIWVILIISLQFDIELIISVSLILTLLNIYWFVKWTLR